MEIIKELQRKGQKKPALTRNDPISLDATGFKNGEVDEDAPCVIFEICSPILEGEWAEIFMSVEEALTLSRLLLEQVRDACSESEFAEACDKVGIHRVEEVPSKPGRMH